MPVLTVAECTLVIPYFMGTFCLWLAISAPVRHCQSYTEWTTIQGIYHSKQNQSNIHKVTALQLGLSFPKIFLVDLEAECPVQVNFPSMKVEDAMQTQKVLHPECKYQVV